MPSASQTADTSEAKVARLREQVNTMTEDRVTPVVTDFVAKTTETVSTASTVLREQAETLARQVESAPLVSVVIALGVGVMIGRVIR